LPVDSIHLAIVAHCNSLAINPLCLCPRVIFVVFLVLVAATAIVPTTLSKKATQPDLALKALGKNRVHMVHSTSRGRIPPF
jgi:hypothetical protein